MALKNRTLFVLGAGASKEFGFPTGAELKIKLAHRLNIRFADGYSQTSGDPALTVTLQKIKFDENGSRGDINPYLYKAWQMVSALPQAISIDNYIDAQKDSEIALLDKIAVARELLKCEKNSTLFFKEQNDRAGMVARNSNTFYHALFQLLSEGFRRSDLDGIFANVSFISFNYDRSLEWYMRHALENFFQTAEPRTTEILNTLKVIHPYGTVGVLPNSGNHKEFVPFGGGYQDQYATIAAGIRTFTEQINDPGISDAIEHQVCSAQRIVFLGFGFHDINMQTLATSRPTQLRHVIGTALGVSKSDIDEIGRSITTSFSSQLSNPSFNVNSRIDLRADLRCAELFTEFGRSMRA